MSLPLATLSLAAAAAVIVALWRSARRALAGGPDPLDAEDARLGAAALVAVAISLTAIGLGTFGLLSGPAWVGTLALLAAFTTWLHRGRATPEPSEFPLTPAFTFALAGLTLGSAIFRLRNPVADRDSLQYHLPMIAHWLHTHALGVPRLMPFEAYTSYPGGAELLQAFAAAAAGRDALTTLPELAATLLLALALRRMALEMGAARPVAESVALLLVTAAGVVGLGRTLQADALVAAWCAIGLRFGMRFRAFEEPRDLALAIVSLGLLAGCRTTGPVLAFFALGASLLLPPRPSAVRAIEAGGWPWLTAFLLGGFWLTRNAIATGNPVYPGTLHALGRTLDGPMRAELLTRTSQIAVWREHHAGHLTIPNLVRFYGLAVVLLPLGLFGALLPRLRREALPLLVFALLAFGLFVISPFSGANLPSVGGAPPELAPANLRYLLSTFIALAPAAAAALPSSALPSSFVAVATALACLWQARSSLVRYAVGALVAAPFVLTERSRFRDLLRRPLVVLALIVALSAATAAAVQVTSAGRDHATRQAWEIFSHETVRTLDAGFVSRMRAAARNGTIAEVGLASSYLLTGADFSVRPAYVPVAANAGEERGTFAWGSDDRLHPDHAAWLARIARLMPRLVLIVATPLTADAPERAWLADTSRFSVFATSGADTAWSPRNTAPR